MRKPISLRLTPAVVGIMCRKVAVADGSIAHHSGRADDYEGHQARRFAAACGGIPVNGVHFGACEISKERAGYRINVWSHGVFDHLITDADAKAVIARFSERNPMARRLFTPRAIDSVATDDNG